MRKRIGTFIIKVFAFFLILGFGAWGIQDMLGYQVGGSSGAVAEVGDEALPPRELYSDVYTEINNMRRFLGNSFDIKQARALGIVDSVLQRQINAAATRAGAEDLGVAISDGLVRDAIINEPLFKGLAGNFDRERFQQILESNGLLEAAYVDRVRNDLKTRQLVGSVNAGVVAPSGWVDAVHRFREEKREVDSVFVPDSKMTAGTPSDEDLNAYYKDNEKLFTAPEYRAATFVRLDAAELAKEMEIAEDALREAYDARIDEFTTREKRKVRQMIFSDETKAKEAAQQLAEGKDFLAVAKEVAGQDEATVDLGEITKDDLLPDLAEPAFMLAKGTHSAPLKTSLGWHIVEAVDVTPGGTKTFEDAKPALRDALAHQKAIDAIFDLSNRFEDELGGGASIAEAAGRLNLKVEKLAAIDQAGNDATETKIAGLPAANFVATVFATPEGEDSPMTEAGEDGFFILHVDKVTAPALRPFEAVRAKVADAWAASKRRQAAEALASVIVNFVNDGKKMADGAAEWELEVKAIADIKRRGNSGEVNDALAAEVFDLAAGKAAMARAGDGYRVAALTKIVAAPMGPSESRKELAGQLAQSLRADLDQQLVAALRDKAGVSVNRAAIDALFGDRQANQ